MRTHPASPVVSLISLISLFLVLLFLAAGIARAGEPQSGLPVYKLSKPVAMTAAYEAVYKALEDEKFFVVFEPNIGANLSRMAKRWGDDYNRNELTGLRSMVFCNGWYANKVSNIDPDLLGFCPLHITLLERQYDGKPQTTVLFNRPTAVTGGSPAHELFQRIESEVISAIERGMKQAAN